MHEADYSDPAGPVITLRGQIGGEVIDANRHMNVSGFDRLFDQAETAMFLRFGIGDDYILSRQRSLFRLEKFVRYERELLVGQAYDVRSWIIGTDGRRIHHFHELWDCDNDRRSAFYDCLAIHVNLERRKSAVIEDATILEALRGFAQHLQEYGLPAGPLPRGIAESTA